MKSSIFTLVLTSLLTNLTYAGGSMIDCESENSTIRIRSTSFYRSDTDLSAYLRNGSNLTIKSQNIDQQNLSGTLTFEEKTNGTHFYEHKLLNSKAEHYSIRIYPNHQFEISYKVLNYREEVIDTGSCILNVLGPFS